MRDTVRSLRPAGGGKPYAVRFETPPGQQAQVDLAQFRVRFVDAPDRVQVVWLFSMVQGFSRLIWGRFVLRQTMPSVLACHRAAFEAIGGVPREILYDRMKTAVIGEDEDGRVVYNRTLGEFVKHYGYLDTRNNHDFRAAIGLVAGIAAKGVTRWVRFAAFRRCPWVFQPFLRISGAPIL